jgi:ATP-dependent protease ClpP protease subunit
VFDLTSLHSHPRFQDKEQTMTIELNKNAEEEKENSFANELLETRTIIISGSVDSKLTDKIVKQLLVLEKRIRKRR